MVSTFYVPAYRLSKTARHSQDICTRSGQELPNVMRIHRESYLHVLPMIKLVWLISVCMYSQQQELVKGLFSHKKTIEPFKILSNGSSSLETEGPKCHHNNMPSNKTCEEHNWNELYFEDSARKWNPTRRCPQPSVLRGSETEQGTSVKQFVLTSLSTFPQPLRCVHTASGPIFSRCVTMVQILGPQKKCSFPWHVLFGKCLYV